MTCVVRQLGDQQWEVGVFGEGADTTYLRTFTNKVAMEDYIHWLNGGMTHDETDRFARVLETVAERLDRIWRTIGRCR
jgi:hypothetical protein